MNVLEMLIVRHLGTPKFVISDGINMLRWMRDRGLFVSEQVQF